MALIYALMFLARAVSAQESSPEDPNLDHEVGWQSRPMRRGTLNIIFSCATAIFACTWSVQHLNVPGRNDGFWTKFGRSAKWMAVTVLLPEFILAHAVIELDMAIKAKRLVNAVPEDTDDPDSGNLEDLFWRAQLCRMWKKTLLATSECYKLTTSEISGMFKSAVVDPVEDLPTPTVSTWTLTHCYFANMGGLYYRDDQTTQVNGIEDKTVVRFPLTAFQYAKHRDAIDLPTNLTAKFITDKSKQDTFAKLVALIQISYLVMSIGVRRNKGLAYSQLEVVTLGFAICGMATYFIYWYKPKNVSVAIEVAPKESATAKPSFYSPGQDRFWTMLENKEPNTKRTKVERIRNDNISQELSGATHSMLPVLSAFSVAFNSIHLLGYFAEFPTRGEAFYWKTCLVWSISLPAFALVFIPLYRGTLRAGDPRRFVGDCYRALEEVAWHHPNQSQVWRARQALEQACSSDSQRSERKVHFRRIFCPALEATSDAEPAAGLTLLDEMLKFVNGQAPYAAELPPTLHRSFAHNFRRLARHIHWKATRKLGENAKTYVFPRRSAAPNTVNHVMVYLMALLYVVVRLGMLGLALSSLRSLPEGAYVTTWTKNIPSFQ